MNHASRESNTNEAELHCHDLGPDHRPPHTQTGQRSITRTRTAGTQSAVSCSGGWPHARATSCVCGAARNTRFPCAKVALTQRRVQYNRGAPRTASRAPRRPEFLLRYVFYLRSAALPSTAVSRALARNEHAQLLMRLPKRAAALLDSAHTRPCHADSLLLAQVKPVSWQ